MALLRKFRINSSESEVQNFIPGQNVTFATQSDGTIQINASGGGDPGGCVSYNFVWDEATRSFKLTDSDSAVVQSEELTGMATEEYVDAAVQPAYETCNNDTGGNVIQLGTVVRDGATLGLYQFFYKTGALPATGTAEYSFANLLANYTVNDFIDATGMTGNGIFIGNGRTDNENRLIVQQFSKNRKSITIRVYQDFSSQTAFLKVLFIGRRQG